MTGSARTSLLLFPLAAALLLFGPPSATAQGIGSARGAALEEMEVTRDVDYVPGEEYADGRDLLDVYMPPGAEDAPVVVFFHGGALQYGDKGAGEDLARRLVPNGVGVVSANYRLSPDVMHPAHVQDAAAAVAWAVEHVEELGGSTEKIFLAGHSAGAYLAVLLGLDSQLLGAHDLSPRDVQAVIPVSPFLFVEETAPDRPKTVWGEDPDQWLAASVTPHIRPNRPPTLLIYADADDEWRVAQINRFALEMAAAGNDVQAVRFPNRDHGSLMTELNADDDGIGNQIVRYIQSHVVIPTP